MIKKISNEEKGMRKGVLFGFLIGFSLIVLYCCTLWILMVEIIDSDKIDLFIDNKQTIAYENVVFYWQENDFVNSLSYICSLKKEEIEKVKCVNKYIYGNFNYVIHGLGNEIRKNPEEIIEDGGVCRDWAILYASILEKMEINYEFINEPSHVYLKAYLDDFNCIMDMTEINCTPKEKR